MIGSLGHYKDLRWYFLESEAFNLYTTQSVKKSMFVPYMGVFLIDSWDLIKQDKQIKFLRQVVCIRGTCSTWVNISDTLSPYQGNWFHLSSYLRHAVWNCYSTCIIFSDHFRGPCCTWKVFTDKRCKPLIKNLFIYSRFSRWKKMFDSSCGICF